MPKEVRNILMFGKTGNGKSTLANVLVNEFKENEPFRYLFKESEGSVSETKDYQIESFNIGQITYRVIDVIGIGDTKLSPSDVLFKIAMVAKEVKKDGINRIFFVIGGRFTPEEVEIFRLLKEVLFDEKVLEHTTIIRNKFPRFRQKDACDEDYQALRGVNQASFPIVSKIKRDDLVYVDAPPIPGDDETKKRMALEDRKLSREKLLVHLAQNSTTIYRPKNIEDIGGGIDNSSIIRAIKEGQKENDKQIQELRNMLSKIKQDSEIEREKAKKRIDELRKVSEQMLADLKKEVSRMMAEHVDKKIKNIEEIELMEGNLDITERAARRGAEIGTTALPIIGTGAGALIGTVYGTGASILATTIYFWRVLTGKR